MSDQADTSVSLLQSYGLDVDQAHIYLDLVQNGFTSALDLSRRLHVSRTKVYRLLDSLLAKGLVEQRLDSRGLKFGTTGSTKLSQMVDQKEVELQHLQKSLPDLLVQLKHLSPISTQGSKVLYYEGLEGLKQVSYNITKADGLVRVFEMEHMGDFLDQEFSESVRQKLLDNKIFCRDLTNKKSFGNFTNVTELIKTYSQFRYIDPKKLEINFEVLIYNDVYATYTYKEKDIFCVEIHNAQLAAMQKQLFDFIWEIAKPLKFKNLHGQASL